MMGCYYPSQGPQFYTRGSLTEGKNWLELFLLETDFQKLSLIDHQVSIKLLIIISSLRIHEVNSCIILMTTVLFFVLWYHFSNNNVLL